MCGVNVIFAYGPEAPPVDETSLVAVRDAMTARGPDGAGLWVAPNGRTGLGHRRLTIIDLSPAGAQPMTVAGRADGPVITYNGEIYNYGELRTELKDAGVAFASTSDTEVLLHLYDRDGPSMVERLRGMYAFAIWDPGRGGIFMARDPLGIKPLYYADDGSTLRAASQVKALLAGGGVDTAPDAAGHAGFYLFGYVPEPHTLYKGVRALPAGSTLWCDRHGVGEPRRFFDVGSTFAEAAPLTTRSRADLHERLRDALVGSISAHQVADVPVGVFLSSGLDSTTIVALAREAGATDLRTVTLGFEEFRGRPFDEVPLAEATASTFGTCHQTAWVTREEFAADMSRLTSAMDQPSIDGINTYFVAKATAATGLKVALSGVGGDELFAGYPSFSGVPRLVSLASWTRWLPGCGVAARAISARILGHFTSPKYAGLLEYGTSVPDAYFLRRALFMPWELPELLDPEMASEGLEALAPRKALAATTAGIRSQRAAISALEMEWYMRGQLLRDADWAGMAHSLEIRTPLVDAQLLRALAPLVLDDRPPGKMEMAATPSRSLPAAVLERPKTGFAVPVREWVHEAPASSPERGLRGWARRVYDCFASA